MKSTIGILTGGGDVPGLNPAIRAVTFRALREGHKVVGIRRGWGGLVDLIPDKDADNSENVLVLTEELVNKAEKHLKQIQVGNPMHNIEFSRDLASRVNRLLEQACKDLQSYSTVKTLPDEAYR